ncbi:MAG: SdpI family protein [Oscillospiraceae bacterium]|nr:SdpI family protein [Oscillospiraceae bacterium]
MNFLVLILFMFPIFSIVFSTLLLKHAPEDINWAYGYRTKRASASLEAWKYAQQVSGEYWRKSGWVSIICVVILAVIVFVFISLDDYYGMFIIFGLLAVQVLIFLLVIPYTEIKLKRMFKK